MRRRLIVLGIIGAVAVIAVIIVLVSRGGIGPQTDTCQNMISGLRQGDVQGTYNMLTESAQRITPIEEWQSAVESYQNYFQGGTQTPWFISSNTEEGTEEGSTPVTTVRYRFDSKYGNWDGVCVFYDESQEKISSFSANTPGFEP